MNIIILTDELDEDFEGELISECLGDLPKEKAGKVICMIPKNAPHNASSTETAKACSLDAEVITSEERAKGAVCTALFAIDDINNEDELLVIYRPLVRADVCAAVGDFRQRDLDGGLVTFPSAQPGHTWVVLDETDRVIRADERCPVSNHAAAGYYYFRRGSDFVNACFAVIERDPSSEQPYNLPSTYNELILQQKNIGIFQFPEPSSPS